MLVKIDTKDLDRVNNFNILDTYCTYMLPTSAINKVSRVLSGYIDSTTKIEDGIYLNKYDIKPTYSIEHYDFYTINKDNKIVKLALRDIRRLVAMTNSVIDIYAKAKNSTSNKAKLIWTNNIKNGYMYIDVHCKSIAILGHITADVIRWYLCNNRKHNTEFNRLLSGDNLTLELYEECIACLEEEFNHIDMLLNKYSNHIFTVELTRSRIKVNVGCDYRAYKWVKLMESQVKEA